MALYALPRGGAPIAITPYLPSGQFTYVGAAEGGATVFFESGAALPAEAGGEPIAAAVPGARNFYAWQREGARTHLVSVLNGESPLPAGGFAGPYAWAGNLGAAALPSAGAQLQYYLQDLNAVSEAGDAFFTEAGSGQLFERLHPTEAQSEVAHAGEADEQCTEPSMACTIHVSATHKTNGGPAHDGPDPAGSAPAAFMAASADGKAAYFTSPEMLTNDANTGPEQPPASIGRCAVACEEPSSEAEADFIPKKAIGLLTDAEYIYWADPIDGTIGRAKLGEPESANPAFIVPGPTECGKEIEPGVREEGESKPPLPGDRLRIHLLDQHRLRRNREKIDRRRRLDRPGEARRRPRKHRSGLHPRQGRSRRQSRQPGRQPAGDRRGLRTHLLGQRLRQELLGSRGRGSTAAKSSWNSSRRNRVRRRRRFLRARRKRYHTSTSAAYQNGNNNGFIARVPLSREKSEENARSSVGEGRSARGVALDASHVYWASQGDGAIGRAALAGFKSGDCETPVPACERKFIPVNGSPNGVAVERRPRLLVGQRGDPAQPRQRPLPLPGPRRGRLRRGGGLPHRPQPRRRRKRRRSPGRPRRLRRRLLRLLRRQRRARREPRRGGPARRSGRLRRRWRGRNPLQPLPRPRRRNHLHRPPRLAAARSPDSRDWSPSASLGARTARVSPDGRALAFRSAEALTPYENHGVPEYYLYRTGEPLACLTCNPTGQAPAATPSLGEVNPQGSYPSGGSYAAALLSRNLSAGGDRFFFETAEALLGADTNGLGGCPSEGNGTGHQVPSCADVYEWEAPGTGSCEESASSYSSQDAGCLYLISSGQSPRASRFADASESGDDVFLFTYQRLVGQDEDQLRDVYDARVGGGLAAQSPLAREECEGEACKPGATPPPALASPATPSFQGTGNAKPKASKCPKGKVRRKVKGKARCVKKHAKRHKRHHRHHHRKRRHRKGRSHR